MGCLDTTIPIMPFLGILNLTPNSGVVPQTLKTVGSVVWPRLTSHGTDFLHLLRTEDSDQHMCWLSVFL